MSNGRSKLKVSESDAFRLLPVSEAEEIGIQTNGERARRLDEWAIKQLCPGKAVKVAIEARDCKGFFHPNLKRFSKGAPIELVWVLLDHVKEGQFSGKICNQPGLSESDELEHLSFSKYHTLDFGSRLNLTADYIINAEISKSFNSMKPSQRMKRGKRGV